MSETGIYGIEAMRVKVGGGFGLQPLLKDGCARDDVAGYPASSVMSLAMHWESLLVIIVYSYSLLYVVHMSKPALYCLEFESITCCKNVSLSILEFCASAGFMFSILLPGHL